MRFLSRCGLAALGTLLVASACSSFQSTDTTPDASVPDGSTRHVADGNDGTVDSAVTEPDATAAPDAGVDASAPCAVTCRSHYCDGDGGCHPLAFVTTDEFDGMFGGDGGIPSGIDLADALCSERADGGAFHALLSVPQPGQQALTRFTKGNGAYRPVREIDGTVIATSYNDMFATGLTSAGLVRGVDGSKIPVGDHVWTGTAPDGTAISPASCDAWTTAFPGANGAYGMVGGTATFWISAAQEGCDVPTNHLYCLEIVQ